MEKEKEEEEEEEKKEREEGWESRNKEEQVHGINSTEK